MKPKLIGLAGPAQSGKDTAAEFAEKLYANVARYAFADPIRAGINAMFGVCLDGMNGQEKETPLIRVNNKTPRELMQTLGTEWGRTYVSPTIWIDLGLHKWRHHNAAGRSLVITDVRLDNEAEAIRAAGGAIVHIVRPAEDRGAVRDHSSEAGIAAKFGDFTIINDGSIHDYYDAIRRTFNEVFTNAR